MALTATQQLELVSLLKQMFNAQDAHGDPASESVAWVRNFIVNVLPDAVQETLYDELLTSLISSQETQRDTNATRFEDSLTVLRDKERVERV